MDDLEIYRKQLEDMAQRFGFSNEDAEDLAQEVFIVAYTKLDNKYSTLEKIQFLNKIMRNKIMNENTKNKRSKITTVPIELAEKIIDSVDWADEVLTSIEKQYEVDTLYNLIMGAGLRLFELKIMLYKLKNDCSWSEVATEFNLTEGNCRKIYCEAIKKLKDKLDKLGADNNEN